MKKKLSGFTLIEVMITVVIISISISIGVPSIRAFVTNNELTSRNNNLVSLIQYARSESIKRGSRVTVCPSTTAMNPDPTCSKVNDWLPGTLIFVEGNLGERGVFDEGDTLLKQINNNIGPNPAISINAEVLRKDDPVTITSYISFVSPRGEPLDSVSNNQSGIFKICDLRDTSKVRGIMMNPSGRLFSTRESATLGTHITCAPTI